MNSHSVNTHSMNTHQGRCVVIYNPIKVDDDFRPTAERALGEAGWSAVDWLATTEEDPGRSMVRTAVEAKAALVLAAGGDGTVRIVADGLVGTDIPLGLVPSGTANLLAYNLGVPTGTDEALAVALTGRDRRIDMVRMTVDGTTTEHFAVMAGAGVDAMTMDETDPELKSKIGTAAYFVGLGKALGRLPMKARVKIDGSRFHRRHAMVILIGNVGRVRGVTLIPDAAPDDGRLDVLVACPHTALDWLKVVGRLLSRRRKSSDPVEIQAGRSVEVRLRERDSYQLDGDVQGTFETMSAEIVPGALVVRVPT